MFEPEVYIISVRNANNNMIEELTKKLGEACTGEKWKNVRILVSSKQFDIHKIDTDTYEALQKVMEPQNAS